MRGNSFTITGHVRRKRDGTGIHGLSIEVILKKDKLKIVYAETLSASDGAYSLDINSKTTPVLFTKDNEINLIVKDRAGREIQQKGIGTHARNGRNKSFNLTFNEAALSVHDAQALSIETVDSTLRPMAALDRIHNAINLTSAAGSTQRQRFEHLLPCLEPDIGRFQGVLDDARGTLEGDPTATMRLRDTINELRRKSVRNAPHSTTIQSTEMLMETLRTTRAGASQPSPNSALYDESVIGLDQALVLVTAAVTLSRGDRELAYDYAEMILAQLGRYQRLGPLNRSASMVLGNGSESNRRHFVDMFSFLEHECDPAGFIPDPAADVEQWEPGFIECTYQGIDQLVEPLINYHIDAITPNNACAGDLITITGHGFGVLTTLTSNINQVRFRRRTLDGNNLPSYVAATEVVDWSDESITVRVPDSAVAGPLSLRIRWDTVRVCHMYIDRYRSGNDFEFAGGSGPDILHFNVNSQNALNVEPGESCNLSWQVIGADTVTISRLGNDGPGIDANLERAAEDSIELGPFQENRPTIVSYVLSATNACGTNTASVNISLDSEPNINIVGVEVVQVIQRYNLNLPIDNPANNSVRLVARKRTIVRVYVDSGLTNGFNRGDGANQQVVRGAVRFKPVGASDFSQAAGPLLIDSTNARPIGELQRSQFTHSLNFELTPFSSLSGPIEIDATAWVGVADPGPDTSARYRDIKSTTVDFHPVRAVTLFSIRIADGVRGLPAPSTAQYSAGVAGMIARLPVADDGVTVTPAPGFATPTTTRDLTDRSSWTDLLNDIEAVADGIANNGEIWAAMVPRVVPYATTGLARRPWSVLVVDEKPKFIIQATFPAAFAHEAIHTFRVGHPACPGSTDGSGSPCVTNPDTRLPNATEDVGMDVAARVVIPASTIENMDQVCCLGNDGQTTWTSVAAWNILFDALRT